MVQWFGPKLTGTGVGPRNWQGWLATVIVVALAIGSRFVSPESFGLPHWTRPAFLGVLMLGYLLLAYLTYEDDPK